MVAYDGNVLVESFCQFAEPGLLLLARQTDQALECFLPFLAFVFGPLVGSLLFAFLFALLALLLTSNRKFMASGFGLCVACLFWAEEQIGGVSYLWFLRKLAAGFEASWP